MLKNVSNTTKGWIFGILSQLLWGTGGVAIKLIDTVIPSSLLVTLRHGIGAVTLGSLLIGKTDLLKNLPIKHLLLLGIFAAGLPDLLLIEGVRKAGAIVAALLARVEIPLGVIFAHLLLKEHVGKSAYIAGLISILGVCFISYRPDLEISFTSDFYVGVACALGAAILWSLSAVYVKYILRKTDPLAVSFVRLSIGSIFALAITILFIHEPFISLLQLQLKDWSLIIYLGIFLSGFAYLFFYKSMKALPAHVAIMLIGLSIVVLLFCGIVIGESVSNVQWFGVALIVLSIILVKKPEPKE